MAFKHLRFSLTLSFIAIFLATFLPVENVRALGRVPQASDLPLLETFVSQVRNGHAGELRGVYIPELVALRVVQQPSGDSQFVSPRQNIITQFDLASTFGSSGLLAHNYLAGESFSLLDQGTEFYLIYGDGQVSAFVITEILRYQALEPDNTASRFVSLETNDLLTAPELFSKVYDRPGNVIFQTCISKGSDLGWGRLFVIAEPSSD